MPELTRAIQASKKERVKQAEMITGQLYFADGFTLALYAPVTSRGKIVIILNKNTL